MRYKIIILSIFILYSDLFNPKAVIAEGNTLSISLENSFGTVLSDETTTGDLYFGSVNGFASNSGALTGSSDLAMIINTSNILVNPFASRGNNNNGGALYIIGSATSNYAVRARIHSQGGTANIYLSGEMGSTLDILYSKSSAGWISGTDLTDGVHPLLTPSEITLAGTGGFVTSSPLADNQTIELDLAAKILPGATPGFKTQRIMFTAVGN